MADDRTPRTASLTERPPDDDVPRPRKREAGPDLSGEARLDHERAARESSERRADQEPRPRMT